MLKKKLMLFVVMTITMLSMIVSSCTKTVIRERIVVNGSEIQAVIDSLQTQIRDCEKVKDKCCDIVLQDLKNN